MHFDMNYDMQWMIDFAEHRSKHIGLSSDTISYEVEVMLIAYEEELGREECIARVALMFSKIPQVLTELKSRHPEAAEKIDTILMFS